MPHYDARKALHDPNPPLRPAPPRAPPITLDVEGLAARAAKAINRAVPDQWSVLERVYVDRLLDHLEERHEPADIDNAVDRFVEALHALLTNASAAG